jgi:hypothetical protein
MKSGNLNFLEPSGPLQACNGTALPFTLHTVYTVCAINLFKKKEIPPVSTVSRRRVEQPRANGSILYRGKGFLSFPNHFDKEWGPPSPLFNDYWDSLQGSERPEREADKLPKSVINLRIIKCIRPFNTLLHYMYKEELNLRYPISYYLM